MSGEALFVGRDASRPEMSDAAEGLLSLARLALALGRTERITRHEDGERPETVAEHTVMLAWCALSLAEAWFPWLDPGEVARFALCHDAPEAIRGDTPTLIITAEQLAAKAEREAVAIEEIRTETVFLPWLSRSIDEYEELKGAGRARKGEGSASAAAKAAAFVHAVDKMMPKLTHVLNGGGTLRGSGITRGELEALLARQRITIRETLPGRISEDLADLQAELSAATLAVPLAGER